MNRRLFYYFILIVLDFLIHGVFIIFFIRNTLNSLGRQDAAIYVDILYWIMRMFIVLLYIIICFKLIPNTTRLYRLLFGLISGIGFQVFTFYNLYILSKTVINSEILAVAIFILEYVLLIICLELTVRIKTKMLLMNKAVQTLNG